MSPQPSPTKPTKAVAIDLLPLFDAACPPPHARPPKKPRVACETSA